ncbi:hypothetical protein BJY04DRAFT_167582 [Aspergillus karnatakaensis]|uniref:uncharacterized protein n=1 Tax=Aspergillus karnatakaensis TaxID=1810916 RepID=UPI003CCD8D44
MDITQAGEYLSNLLYYIFLTIFLWTLYIASEIINCARYIRNPTELTRRIYQASGSPPRALPRSRRSLTIGLPQVPTAAPTQSSFLVKLPPEIRQLIYRHVLVSPTPLHLWRTHRRLCSTPCVATGPLDPDSIYWEHLTSHDFCYPPLAQDRTVRRRLPGEDSRRERVLPLLCTCRAVYAESISLLYTANTLFFMDLRTVCALPRSLVPARLASIRSIRINLYAFLNEAVPVHIQEAWKPACDVLAAMPRLSELIINLGVKQTSSSAPTPNATGLLEPLRRVRAEKFIVKVPPNGDPESIIDGVDDVPFTVQPTRYISREYKCGMSVVPVSRILPPPFWPRVEE